MATSKMEREASGSLGRVTFLDGQNELPALEVSTAVSTAEIYLHGAHVTRFKIKDEPPLLFMSQCSRFAQEQPIRGGIPVIFPWFGQREGMAQHGFARLKAWDLKEFEPAPDGSVSVRFRLPDCPEASSFPPFSAEYVVTVSEALELQLAVTNQSPDEELNFENCLHAYFEVGDVARAWITGLKGTGYLDKTANFVQKIETADSIRFASEVDRIYLSTTGPVEIHDPAFGRTILIEKQGSLSTVVWNPWIAKAQHMPDFGNDEYMRMVCVEPGNVASNSLKLAPGQTSVLSVKLSTRRMNDK
ncbi:Aldose 1-epimerase [Verrucomicrobia bacterium]|nr:Aldose 1-epimerase [Verrucomicrobiota bacterium]